MVNFKEKCHFQGSGGGPNISMGGGGGGDPTFSRGGGGSNCLFPIETYTTCDFPGGSGPPVPSLWIHTWLRSIQFPSPQNDAITSCT